MLVAMVTNLTRTINELKEKKTEVITEEMFLNAAQKGLNNEKSYNLWDL